ncbi:peptidylprolyl isomerase [Marinicella rhabdoformis]|uniref:peptidylprolyl isomerase n=1 Tax=Marinicella rhabdoformis TaxID=2580566 RepID=UPI0012AEB3C2|nr:peptidylprolyl isomerase [Marinicella rhabdoformis]
MKKTLVILMLCFLSMSANATTVRFETNVGNIDIELYDEETPITVSNFLAYVNSGKYDDVIFHRVALNGIQVVQGGGFRHQSDGRFSVVATNPQIVNESAVSNTRSTIAMARTEDPNSATNQWFFNVSDNSFHLDETNSRDGYAVFGEVVDGMEVVDLIASLRTLDLRVSNLGGSALNVPSYLFYGSMRSSSFYTNLVEDLTQLDDSHFITIVKAYVLEEPEFKVNAGISGGWFNPATNGQGFYFEMLPDANALLAAWFTYDLFQPEDEVASTIGHPGHRWFTSQGTFDGNTFSQPIALTRNGLFDSTDAVDSFATGTLTIEFNSCTEAEVSYEFDADNVEGSFPITRLSGDNVALCEELSGIAQ